jgi:hypothetical protein
MGEDGVDDPLTALAVVEAAHWIGPSANFSETALNGVGGA